MSNANDFDDYWPTMLEEFSALIMKAAEGLRAPKPAPKAPKGKKKTFYREVGGHSVIQFGSQNPVDILSLHAARDYAGANPGSILEIVVRRPVPQSKPAKEGK